jgi:hypothetical protein
LKLEKTHLWPGTVLSVCESFRCSWTIGKMMRSNDAGKKISAGVQSAAYVHGVKETWADDVTAEELRRADADARRVLVFGA